jgi:superfamily II DNA or RNA helicase
MSVKTDVILVGLSATPIREDGETMRLEAALGNVVYKIDRKDLINMGFLSNAVVRYVDVDYVVEPFLNYADEYKRYIVENDKRNNLIASIANAEVIHYKKKVLILVNHIQHGEKIQKLTDASVFLNGGVVDRTVDLTKTDIIIATSIFNEGVDLPSLDVLILAGGGKSSIQLTQKVGRVLRVAANKAGAIVYDFKDRGRYLFKHYKRRRALLEADFEVIDV